MKNRVRRIPLTFEKVIQHLIRFRRGIPTYGLVRDWSQIDSSVTHRPTKTKWSFILVEYKHIPNGHFYPLHNHPRGVYEFYYVNRGSVEISISGRGSLVLKAGHAILFPPGLRHSMSSPAGATAINVHFPLDRREPWTTAMKNLACRPFELPAFCRTALHLLVQIEAFPRQAQPDLSSGLLGAILLTVSMEDRPGTELDEHLLEGMSGDGLAGRAIELMASRNGTRQTVAQIARKIGVGRRTLEISFRRQTGMTVHRASLKLRLRRARKLLITGAMSVKQVAFEAGFGNPGSFSRAFRRLYGFTPGEISRSGSDRRRRPLPA